MVIIECVSVIKGLPCTVDNKTFDNGETFMLDCRTQCSCQVLCEFYFVTFFHLKFIVVLAIYEQISVTMLVHF